MGSSESRPSSSRRLCPGSVLQPAGRLLPWPGPTRTIDCLLQRHTDTHTRLACKYYLPQRAKTVLPLQLWLSLWAATAWLQFCAVITLPPSGFPVHFHCLKGTAVGGWIFSVTSNHKIHEIKRRLIFCSLRSSADRRTWHQWWRPHFLFAGDGVCRQSWNWSWVVTRSWRLVSWWGFSFPVRNQVLQAKDVVACQQSLLHVVCAVMELLFSEELGLVLEVSESHVETVCQRYADAGVECHRIGRTCGFGPEAMVRHRPRYIYFGSQALSLGLWQWLSSLYQVSVRVNGREVLREPLPNLRALWEETSFQLERLQANELCVKQEEEGLAKRTQPYFNVTFDPSETLCINPLCKSL